MGVCTICGKAAGFLRTKHPECDWHEDSAPRDVAHAEPRSTTDIGQLIYCSLSEKLGRPYELESGRIEAVVNDVQQLKREGKLEKAIDILLPQLDLWERDAAAGLGGVAPWYYEQAAIVYRKLKRYDDEIAVLERFAAQQHAPGASPPQLLKRLQMAKWYALKRSGIEAPRPVFDEEIERSPLAAPGVIYPKPGRIKLAADQQPISDFIALDVETANADFASICSIGLAHFKSGELFKTLTILVDPEDDFDPLNISIHGITPDTVAGKPNMARVFPVIAAALSDLLVVHHGHFDKTALNRVAIKHGAAFLPCVWLDTLRVARRAWPSLAGDGRGYGLARLAEEFSIEFQHHDAAEDARVAGLLMLRAMNDSGLDLVQWIRRVEAPIEGSETARHAREGAGSRPLLGEVAVFTGKLNITREVAAQLASAAGCEVADTVSQRTTILVVGDQDLRVTKGQEKSAKHRKAEALIAKGCAIKIVGESDFHRLVDAAN